MQITKYVGETRVSGHLNRYFIELQPEGGPPVPRYREAEVRREQAAQFIISIGSWLKEQALLDKVATLAITALGQVQITCEADVINQMRHHDDMNIAAIRQSSFFTENQMRWN